MRDKFERFDKEYAMGGGFFKFPEGETRLRIMVEPEYYADLFQGERKGTWITYAIIRGDIRSEDKINLVNLPISVARSLMDLEIDRDYGFTDYPMPFDVKVIRKGTGKASKYEMLPLPKNETLDPTGDQLDEFKKMTPIVELAGKLEKKKAERAASEGSPVTPAPDSIQAKRNSAEVNMMYTVLERGINNCTGEPDLDKAAGMIGICLQNKTINEFEADLLRGLIVNKKAEITGQPVSDIKVEDIPF